MPKTVLRPGYTYRLLLNWEVRDQKTGTIKDYLLKGTLLTVRLAEPEQDQLWVEGQRYPLPFAAIQKFLAPAEGELHPTA